MRTVAQLQSNAAAGEGTSCCSSCGGRACWPQQYPRFTVVYVWVVLLLVGAFVCVVCSHIIWPWLFLDPLDSSAVSNDSFTAAVLRPYSLLGLWGNWRVPGSAKAILTALGRCSLSGITCNLTAPY
jgi:hypothetical protein